MTDTDDLHERAAHVANLTAPAFAGLIADLDVALLRTEAQLAAARTDWREAQHLQRQHEAGVPTLVQLLALIEDERAWLAGTTEPGLRS